MSVPDYVRLARHEVDLDDDGHDAAEHVTYDPTSSGLVSTDVQGAIDEISATTGATDLDGLTDVTLTTPALADRLRFDGSLWRNSAMRWEPLCDPSGSVVLAGDLNPVMVEMS